jgi:hypothetical protein
MWFLPLRITLELKKTRSSWTLTLRIRFLTTRKTEGGRKPALHSLAEHSISLHFSKRYPHLIGLWSIKGLLWVLFPLMIVTDGFSGKTTLEMKREHGEAYPKGTETVAAPATVSGEQRLTTPLIARSGRQGEAETREPGDLPSVLKFEPDGVCRERCDVSRRNGPLRGSVP